MRRQVIWSYLEEMEVYEIIGHDTLVYLKIVVTYTLLLAAFFGVYRLLSNYMSINGLSLVFGAIGVILYLKAMYDIADRYFDAIVVSNYGLIFFRRNGLFSYTTTSLQRASIETVMDEQNSIRDRIFKKGDLLVKVEEMDYIFYDVETPSTYVTSILKRRNKILGRHHYTENEHPDDRHNKFDVLVEALGEVVNEYVEKKKPGNSSDI